MILLESATYLVYGLLTAAILTVWLPPSSNKATRIPPWMIISGLSAVCGWYYGIVELGGILYLTVLACLCHLIKHRHTNKYLGIAAGVVVTVMVAALFLHDVPFFHNPLVFDRLLLSVESSAYSQHWNFDKTAAGLILLAYFGDICRSFDDWKTMVRKSYVVTFVTIVLSLVPAVILGHIKPDPTLSSVFFTWAWANLFFTCIPEEMLFRGFVQKYLTAFTGRNSHRIVGVVFVGILFGLAHSGGGAVYVMLASIAGVGYGYVYYRTGRIESAILTHFFLNSIHFLFFTYPHIGGNA